MKKVGSYLLTCLIIALVMAPVMNEDFLRSYKDAWLTIMFGLMYAVTGLYGSYWLFKYMDKKYDWINDIWKRLIIGLISVEVWSVAIYCVVTPLLLILFRSESWPNVIFEMKKNVGYPLIMGVPGMLIIAAVEFFRNWKLSYLKQQRLQAELMTYQYEALHNQLNPHFLFNSFNVLSSLVFESQDLAVKFIDQLSDLYKRVLDGRDKQLIPLADELEFIRSYSFLLKTRFEDKLEIMINVDPKPNECIAPMVLQLLIENAVKHNQISKTQPLYINVEKRDNAIEVKNALRLKRAGDESKGTGLQNIRQRYSFFTDRPVEVEKTNSHFVVRVPLLIQTKEP